MMKKSVLMNRLPRRLLAVLTLAVGCTFASAQTDSTFHIAGSVGRLAAHLRLPQLEAGEKCPLVVLCHGFTGCKDQPPVTSLADSLCRAGIGSLRFDFNAHGQSEGEFTEMTVPNEVDDLLCAVAVARNLPQVDGISLLGHSQGGVVAAMAAGRLGQDAVQSLVLMAPAAVLRDDALRGNTMGAIYDPWHAPEYVTLPSGHKLGRNYIQSAISLPIYETAARYGGPTLVIHGMADRVVPYTYGERFCREMADCRIVLIPGEDHVFSANLPYAVSLASQWLQQVLGKR